MVRFLTLLLLTFPAFADTVNGSFNHPIQREDGSTLTAAEIANFNLYVNGVNTQSIPGTDNVFSIDLGPGSYDLNMTTVDTDGRESVYSNTLTQVIPALPNPPSGITVTITINVQGQ